MQITDKFEIVPVTEITPDARNARKHSDEQIKELRRSLREFGFVNPLLIDKDKKVIAGHGRLLAAIAENMTAVPCIYVEHLTEAQRRAYMLADNRLAEHATWDDALLTEELKFLDDLGFDVTVTGFDLPETEQEAVDDGYEPELPKVAKSNVGEVYCLGRHRLLCGDSTNPEHVALLMDGALADMLLTDPPYNVDYKGKTKDELTIENDSQSDESFHSFLVKAFANAQEHMKPGAVFYVWHADSNGYIFRSAVQEAGLTVRQCLIWVKNSMVMGRQDYQWKHEPCLYGWKDGAGHLWASDRKQTTILEFDRPSRSKEHPTMKGDKEYIDVAGGIQVSLYGANGQLKSTEQVFYDTIDALGGIEDATLRDVAAQDIFGKSYQDMKPLIDAGSESLLRYAAEAHAAGLVLSDEAVTALGGFDDQMQQVNARLETAGRLAAVSFLPAVSGIVGGVTDILSTVTAALSDGFQESDVTLISDAITEQIKLAVSAVGQNAPAFVGVVSNVITSVVSMIVELLPEVLPTLVSAAIQIMTGIFTTLQQNAEAISQAVVQIVAMLAMFLVQNLPLIIQTGLQIVVALTQGIAQSLPELVPAVIDMLVQIATTLTDPETLSALVVAALEIVIALAQGLIEAIPDLLAAAAQIVVNLVIAFGEAAPQLWEKGKDFIVQLGEGISAQFSELFLTVGTWVNDNVLQPVKDKVSDFFSVGKDLITGIWNGIENKIEWLKSKVKGLVDIIKGWFTGKDGFDNNSPSKWGIKMGVTIPQGIGIGLDRGLGDALSSASNVISRIKGTLTDTGGSEETSGSTKSSSGTGTAPQYVFHIYAKDKETAVEAADATLAAFQRGRWAVST